MITAKDLFDLSQTTYGELFEDITYPWEVLPRIEPYAQDHAIGERSGAEIHPTAVIGDNVTIGAGTVVGPYVVIEDATIIGENCEIRPGAYLRGRVLIGNNVVIGNSVEVKNALIFNHATIPHFNYVGDSIVGYKAHFGGGAVTSNYKSDGSEVKLAYNDEVYDTGLTKLGALVGDNAELGSNTILNPGTVVGRGAVIYPGAIIRGEVPENSIVKVRQTQEVVEKR